MCSPPEDDDRFIITLQSTIAGDQWRLPDVKESNSEDDYNCFFREAKKKGREVQQMKLLCVITREPGNTMFKGPNGQMKYVCAHQTKKWIIMWGSNTVYVWDYQTQETIHSSEFFAWDKIHAAVFIPQKKWFVAGGSNGSIKVYSYETMQEVKTFSAHGSWIISVDIHPSEPYVLSASYRDQTVKMWNWEKDWECVRTFDDQAWQVKFNPKDADYFACATGNGVKIWNIASSSDDPTFSFGSSGVQCIDYLTRGDEVYLITGHHDGSTMIWDWQGRSCLKTFQGHTKWVTTTCGHPNLPLLITGSYDGTVCLWNLFTFELEGKLNCGLGCVHAIACLKGSNRIATGHQNGLTITVI